ncbi:unnamed protein product [Chrysoparadoxa australica]
MVEFRQLDLSRDISEQGEFDVILHKLSEDIMFRSRRTKSDERLRRLEKYSSMANPHRCAITDPFCSVAKVINRVTAMDTLKAVYQTLGKSACVPQPPHYIVVEAGSSPQSIRDQTRRARLRYPLICKPIEACGSPGSHNMLVVLDECSLSVITAPTVVQEFRNHRARLFKVCVLGDVVRVYERPSLPDLSNDLAGHLEFDSQKPYPTLKDFGGTGNGAEPGEQAASDCSLPEGFALVAAERLREAFGLSLFGFDLIVDSASGEVLCIDVNYFPSFKDLEDFPMVQQTNPIHTSGVTEAIH